MKCCSGREQRENTLRGVALLKVLSESACARQERLRQTGLSPRVYHRAVLLLLSMLGAAAPSVSFPAAVPRHRGSFGNRVPSTEMHPPPLLVAAVPIGGPYTTRFPPPRGSLRHVLRGWAFLRLARFSLPLQHFILWCALLSAAAAFHTLVTRAFGCHDSLISVQVQLFS